MEKQLQDQASKLREVEQELEKEKKNATKNFEQNLQGAAMSLLFKLQCPIFIFVIWRVLFIFTFKQN